MMTKRPERPKEYHKLKGNKKRINASERQIKSRFAKNQNTVDSGSVKTTAELSKAQSVKLLKPVEEQSIFNPEQYLHQHSAGRMTLAKPSRFLKFGTVE